MIPLKDYNESRTFPFINISLIVINIVVFLYEISLSKGELSNFIIKYGFIGSRFFADPGTYYYTIFSSMFIHGGFLHIVGNMLFLYIFGDNVEDAMGHFRYLIFYIFSGIGALALQYFFTPASAVNVPNIGASGAISGVLGAYLVLYPMAKVLTIIPIGFFLMNTRLPAFLFIGFWFFMQFFQGIFSLSITRFNSVAYWAHIGGFLVGFFYAIKNKQKFLDKLYSKQRVYFDEFRV